MRKAPRGRRATGVLQPAEVVVERGHVRMVGAERPLRNRQGAPIEPLRVGKLPRILVEHRQVIETSRHLEVIRPEGRFGQG